MRTAAAALLSFGAAVVVAAEFGVIGLMPAMATELGLGPSQSGLLVTLFALASALLGPVLVAATARLCPVRLMAAALLPFAASLLLLPFPSFALLAGLRVLQGAALPLFMSLAAARLAAMQGAGKGVAILYIGVTIGGTLAPPLGSFAAERFGWAAAMAATGGLALAAAAACLTLDDGKPADERGWPWRLLAAPRVRAHLLLSGLLFATMFTGFSYAALILRQTGLDADVVAIALLVFGTAGLGGNWLAGAFSRWALPATHGVALAVAASVASLSVANRVDTVAIAAAMLVWGAAHSAGFVYCQLRVMAAMPEAPGFAGSLNISAANIGIALGSFVGGRAIESGGTAALTIMTLTLGMAAMGLAWWIARQRPLASRATRCRRHGQQGSSVSNDCSPAEGIARESG